MVINYLLNLDEAASCIFKLLISALVKRSDGKVARDISGITLSLFVFPQKSTYGFTMLWRVKINVAVW